MESKLFAVAFLTVAIFLTSSNLVAGQLHKQGQCPTVTPQADLDLDKYFGNWSVYSKYPHYYYKNERCATASYKLLGNGKVSLSFSQITAQDKPRSSEVEATISDNGQFVEYFKPNRFAAGVNYTYKILATDYTTYAVMFRCDQGSTIHDEYLWILTRDQVPSEEAVKAAEDAVLVQGLSVEELDVYDQTNC